MTLALEFQRVAQIRRASLYGTERDPQLPTHLVEDARVPFLGFCGPNYEPGGVVLLAINPGGGGDAYVSRTREDQVLIPLIEGFLKAPTPKVETAFRRMCDEYQMMVQTWNLRRILVPTVEACGKTLDQVCYLNCFPYRTAGDLRPSAAALATAWIKITQPIIDALKPGKVVALGKKAGTVAEARYSGSASIYTVPRTIGDTRISTEAQEVLSKIRSGAA
ncbi:MAG: hypothetical protein RIS44_3122 [Pseudomonadota bacterium]